MIFFVHSQDSAFSSILADIQDHDTCTIETSLNGLLSLCLPEEHKRNPPAGLLGDCINAVLPICNARDQSIQTRQTEAKQNQVDEEALAKRIPPQAIPDAIYETPRALLAHEELTQPSEEMMPKPLNAVQDSSVSRY